ncbi:Pilus assembly protein, ATPase of CpaF family [Halopenitus malekzadehii]|uniref:Pilus assembly protein, ATPase of CpaF family n=1 Tax=Halopenitus malekzadehii TaxID=1267564 RepID=A0A1H6HRG2_9EURY|nr:ATPase, T2SS/T4P/T4SS family [Halopenitus malekzadehii]SEH37652.1 Pilus assembly protein, ATPase of CpaF family [Halopenitus malekzadehii]
MSPGERVDDRRSDRLDSALADGFESHLPDRVIDGLTAVQRRLTDQTDDAGSIVPASEGCTCRVTVPESEPGTRSDRTILAVDARSCPGDGALSAEPACRSTVVRALAKRDVDVVRVRSRGRRCSYRDRSLALLLAAGRFYDRISGIEPGTADVAARDPLRAAHDAIGRAGPVVEAAAETGLIETARSVSGYEEALRPSVSPAIATAELTLQPPPGAQLADRWTTDTGATVRIYDHEGAFRTYHLTPSETSLTGRELEIVTAARRRLLERGGDDAREPVRAIRAIGREYDVRMDNERELANVLRRHTRGYGVLEDVFADDRVSDAFLTPPVAETPLRVVVDGERFPTNVRLPPRGAGTLASRLRRVSGEGFSRASPTLDATLETEHGPVRVAATTRPASDGYGFTFRRGGTTAWTLPRLVDAGTLPPAAAGLLSVAIERGVAGLVAGGRGAGKTSTLGALLWELPASTRGILIEDTPELPVDRLQDGGRDVQRLSVGDGRELSPADAVHTALRLGDGAIVVGEVRGEEAAALYEAMRVGASGETVLGTIHGTDPEAVRERVVTDLGVPPTAFASTDLIVLLDSHRVVTIVEVRSGRDGVVFDPLFERDGDELVATGRIDRGTSRLVNGLACGSESYADVRAAIRERSATIAAHVDAGRTTPDAISGGSRRSSDTNGDGGRRR